MSSEIQIEIRALAKDGSWVAARTLSVVESQPGSGCTMKEVMETLLVGEQARRISRRDDSIAKDEDTLLEALNAGGSRVSLEGQSRHLPPLAEILCRIEEALHDGLLLVVLNGQPWKEWTVSRVLPNPSTLWFARTVWLQHHSWS